MKDGIGSINLVHIIEIQYIYFNKSTVTHINIMQRLWKKITEPFRKHAEWWNNYLTELSVFVISLGITYYADKQVSNYMERQEDREAACMVRNELVSNLTELKNIESYYRKEILMSETFRKFLSERNQTNEDSIKDFYNQHRLYYYWFLKDNAFDMIRESGTIQRMDKMLLTELFECYEQLEVVKDMGVRYREERIAKLLLLTDALPDGKHAETTVGQWKQMKQSDKFCRYLLTSLPMMAKSSLSINLNAQQLVKEMLNAVDRQYPSDE